LLPASPAACSYRIDTGEDAMTRWWAALIALAGAVILAIVATTPPAPVSADAPATAFSAARAMGDVYAVGGAPHPTGSFNNAAVRAYLIARLDSMGLEVATASGRMSPQAKNRLDGWRKAIGADARGLAVGHRRFFHVRHAHDGP